MPQQQTPRPESGGSRSRPRRQALILAPAMLLTLLAGVHAVQASPVTLVVNATGNAGDANPGDDICATGGGACTLRAAIEEANADADTDTINFNISPNTIAPIGAELPAVTHPVVIDGTSDPDSARVELDGSLAGASADGIDIFTGTSTVRGLVINRFTGNGIRLSSDNQGGNIIEGNRIGTDPTGTVDLGNGANGVEHLRLRATSSGVQLPAAGNVISGNGGHGVGHGRRSPPGNLVAGQPHRHQRRRHRRPGQRRSRRVVIAARRATRSAGRRPGPATSSPATSGDGVGSTAWSRSTTWCGQPHRHRRRRHRRPRATAVDGVVDPPDAPGNTVGGTTAGAGNVISGNARPRRVHLRQHYRRATCTLWCRATSSAPTPPAPPPSATPATACSSAAPRATPSAARPPGRATSSPATHDGVGVAGQRHSSGNLVAGNFIGTNAAGTAALGNSDNGVRIVGCPGNTVGGTAAGAGNVISGNGERRRGVVRRRRAGNLDRGQLHRHQRRRHRRARQRR